MVHITMPGYVEVDTQHCGIVGCGRGNSLNEVYGSYSAAKAQAWTHCECLCAELGGFNLCVTSANTFMFTAQFEFDNPENGRPMVCHITPSRTYAMYTDIPSIDGAREAWRDYAVLCRQDGVVYQWESPNGAYVVWVEGHAYIEIGGVMYRVESPTTKNGMIRMRVVLQRVGCADADVVDVLQQAGYALCGVDAACHVRANIGDRYAKVCASYVDDAVDATVGSDRQAKEIVCLSHRFAHVVAACVDACSLTRGFDGNGGDIRLWA